MKVLCLTDFAVKPPDRWIWNYLPDNTDQVNFRSTNARDVSRGLGKLATRYPAFFELAQEAQRLATVTQYDLIVAWESKIGFPLALLRRLQRRGTPPLAILAFAAKPPFTDAFRLPAKWLLRGTHIVVPSEWEASWYAARLGITESRIKVCQLGAYDVMKTVSAQREDAANNPGDAYIFSGGRSERDYTTLIEAVAELDIRTVINTRRFILQGVSSPRIEVNDIMPPDRYRQMLAGASVVVLSLRKVQYAIGLSVVLDSMAAGRPLVCSDLPVLREYVTHGITGILVPPGDPAALRVAIQRLLEHPEEAEAMGQAAHRRYEEHHTFESFARRAHYVMAQVVEENEQR